MEPFVKIINDQVTKATSMKPLGCLYYLLTIFAKSFSLNCWHGFEYTSTFNLPSDVKLQIPIRENFCTWTLDKKLLLLKNPWHQHFGGTIMVFFHKLSQNSWNGPLHLLVFYYNIFNSCGLTGSLSLPPPPPTHSTLPCIVSKNSGPVKELYIVSFKKILALKH